ncbi:MAG: hypothetical protein ISS25_04455 [Nanoarchaeota archaeon]|nr:hypothetical protein [DPANN group archaeon]MBL7117053.1 hypothetical protein [Nanoarchaeota archaeon]
MNMKPILLILLLIISSINVLAFEKLFDEYVYTLDTFQVEDDIYYVLLANNEEVLVLHKNEFDVFYVYNGTCEDTPFYQYCFMGTKLDYNDYGRPIPNTLLWEPAIKVQIFSKKPSVTVSRSVDSEINRDGKATVTVTINNNGELDIRNLVFEEIVPGKAIIQYMDSSLQEVNNHISWSRGLLQTGDSVSFIYTLKPTSYDSIVLDNGTLAYEYEDSEFTEELSSTTIKINSPFSVQSLIDKLNVGVGETFTYKFTATNDDWDDRMSIDFNLTIPDDVEIVELPSELTESKNITHDFSLQPEESKTITIKMKSELERTYNIKISSVMTIRDEILEHDKNFSVNVTIPKLIPEITISKTEVFEGGPYTISAFMENPAEVSFYEISGMIMSPLFETKNIHFAVVDPGEKKRLFDESFKAAPVDEIETYNITFRGSYRSPNFQFFNYEEKTSIKIKPVTIGFDIQKSLSKTDVYPREEITVNVKVKNLGQKISIVSLEEEIQEPLEVISGLTQKTLTLDIGAEEEFYIYKLRVPLETVQGVYSLKTHLNHEDIVTKIEEVNITVRENKTEKPPEIEPEITEKEEEKEKKGFFRGILDFFIGLFK